MDAPRERTLSLPAGAWRHWDNLARRLGLSLDALLAQITEREELREQIATALAVPLPEVSGPWRCQPAHAVSEQIAVIGVQGHLVWTRLPFADDRFSATVKALGYRWDGNSWCRTIPRYAEPVADRVVELGVHILAAGFPAEVPSEDYRRRIAESDYIPEPKRRVAARVKGRYTGWFQITWERDEGGFYRQARLISGSRIYPGVALVPPERFDEVLDFAESNGFVLTDGALDLARTGREERAARLLVAPAVRKAVRKTPVPPEPPDGKIADELADEPL